MNKITCICLGVRDMERSVRFYRDRLGFRTDCVEDSPRVCFFDTPGTKFELYPLDLLAEDICPDGPPVVAEGFGGITLTYNVATRQEVDEVIELVRSAGGTVVKEPWRSSGAATTRTSQTPTATTGRSLGARTSSTTRTACWCSDM